MKSSAIILLLASQCLLGAEKRVAPTPTHRRTAPTWLHRYVPAVPAEASAISTDSCRYQPIFGAGDSDSRIVLSVARYGEISIDSNGGCKAVSYSNEEQVLFSLEGQGTLSYGTEKTPVRKGDFIYIPPGMKHVLSNDSDKPCRFVVMGFKIPSGEPIPAGAKIQQASAQGVKEQTDAGHPNSVLYRLLLGNRKGTHDKIDSGIVVTSLFLMDFAPGGTNLPHRHEIAEEIYLVLDGHGLMVAGGGVNGIEGLHPAKPGDAYFFRPNCTVGFYNSKAGRAHILAVRSWVPIPKRDYEN